jgi:4a-hydroxytetrahydrobiopterin dehydratase
VPPRLLTAKEIDQQLADLPDWTTNGDALHRTVKAPDFMTAIRLVTSVAEAAEELNHHPDIDIRWRTVRFRCHTYVSKGVTQYDIALAHHIDDAIARHGAT